MSVDYQAALTIACVGLLALSVALLVWNVRERRGRRLRDTAFRVTMDDRATAPLQSMREKLDALPKRPRVRVPPAPADVDPWADDEPTTFYRDDGKDEP